jgi:type I site-specific restriction endonuclease
MAKEIMRTGRKAIRPGANGKDIHSAPKKHAQKAAKHASKHAKKAAKHVGEHPPGLKGSVVDDLGLMTAFHHMQRASVVISLMEKGTGEDLRGLLERGVKLYRKALDSGDGRKHILRAIGVLRAAEHLSMAGLYAARERHSQKVPSPGPKWLTDFIAETDQRLEKIENEERGKGVDLFPVTVELLRQAEGMDHDAHMAFELAMAADALCFALENGL